MYSCLPGASYVDQSGLELKRSACSPVLGLKAQNTVPALKTYLCMSVLVIKASNILDDALSLSCTSRPVIAPHHMEGSPDHRYRVLVRLRLTE